MSYNSSSFWLTALLLTLTITASTFSERRSATALVAPLESIPTSIDGWSVLKTETLDQPTLRVLTPTSYVSRLYGKGNQKLDAFVAFYAMQRAGESMHSPKNCLPGGGWEIWRQDSMTIP